MSELSPAEISRLCTEVLRSFASDDPRRVELIRLLSEIPVCLAGGSPPAEQAALQSRLRKLLRECRGYCQ